MSTWCLRGPEGWHPAQRVAAARALASRPEIVFADEPTGNLDSPSGAELLGFMQRAVREYGQTIVMVTHDAGAAGYADRVVFLADGPWSTRWLIRPPNGSWTGEVAGGLTMWPATIKGLLAHKLRLGLTALAIVLGVAFVAGTFILTDTMGRAFDNLFATVNQGVAVQVTGIPRFEANARAPRGRGARSASRRASSTPSDRSTGSRPPRGASPVTPSSSTRTERPSRPEARPPWESPRPPRGRAHCRLRRPRREWPGSTRTSSSTTRRSSGRTKPTRSTSCSV